MNLVFFAAAKFVDLDRLSQLRAHLQPGGAIWIIYPKGVSEIKEIQVIEAGARQE